MSIITRQDTNGVKPLLQVGELGYDNYPAGGDKGRVFVGTGTENIGLAKKTEVMVVNSKADAHIARVDNPHNVTKTQVGLGNADNTADVDKNVLSATKLTTPRNITISGEVAGSASFDGSTAINISTTIQPNSVALGTDTTGNYVDSVIAGEGITVTGVVGEGGTPSIAIAPVGTSGTYTKVSTNDKGQVVSGELLTANDVPNLDASKITSGIINAARLPAYVDDVLEYTSLSAFPVVGEAGKIYIALDTNKAYRWSGSTYVYITSGAVDSVAGKTGVVTLVKADVGLANVDNTRDIDKPISTATQTALNTKVDTTTNQTIDGVKTFSSNIVGSINGNAGTATKLATARTIALAGDVTGSVTFDGSSNVSITTTVADDSHSHTFANLTSKPETATRWPTWAEVSSKPTTFAPSSHTHTVSQVTDLGTAATRGVGVGVGNVMEVGAFGLGTGKYLENTDSGAFVYTLDTVPSKFVGAVAPFSSAILSSYSGGNYGFLISKQHGNADDIITASALEEGVWRPSVILYHTGNTTKSPDGTIKASSPVINLYTDKHDLHNESQFGATPTVVRKSKGVYEITGTLGLRSEGWYLDTPNDRNGNKYFNIEWTQNITPDAVDGVVDEYRDDIVVTIETFERVWNKDTGLFDNGNPIDINDLQNRFVQLRFNEIKVELEVANV